jgi:hypothetical protein
MPTRPRGGRKGNNSTRAGDFRDLWHRCGAIIHGPQCEGILLVAVANADCRSIYLVRSDLELSRRDLPKSEYFVIGMDVHAGCHHIATRMGVQKRRNALKQHEQGYGEIVAPRFGHVHILNLV